MKRIERGRFMACMLVAVLVIAAGAFAATTANLRKIVVFVEGTARKVQQQVIERSGSRVLNALPLIDGVAIELPKEGTAQALSTLKAEPTVEGVYDDPAVAVQGATPKGTAPISTEGIVIYIEPALSPKYESYSWGLNQIGIPHVRTEYPTLDGSGLTVAILDTGIDRNHPDLQQNIIIPCVDARAEALNPDDCQDDNGHGTHIAGIIAAQLNKQGVIGAAPNSRIYAIKVLDENGAGQASGLISGLGWVLTNKIKLVNMSLGFPQEWGPYPALEKAIKRLHNAGVIMVAAAGNRNPRPAGSAEGAGGDGAGGDTTSDCNTTAQGAGGDGAGGDGAGGDGTCSCSSASAAAGAGGDGAGGDGAGGDITTVCYQTTQVKVPAAYPRVIAVGATDKNDLVTDYSRSGPEMADHGVVAPGGSRNRDKKGGLEEGILSTDIGGGYGLGIGTSQATAHVTGTLALALQLHPNLAFDKILSLLKDTARSTGLPPEWEGAGVIDAEALIDEIKKSHQ